jgi:hypothetical protein
MASNTLAWKDSAPRSVWRSPPPIGQGLAVIAVIATVLLFSAIGIGTYLASMRIGAARSEAARLDRSIGEERAKIRALRREYEIRSRMSELDRWRAPLSLEAVRIGQFVTPGEPVRSAAEARTAQLGTETVKAQPVDTPKHAGYPAPARESLDDLIGEVAAN